MWPKAIVLGILLFLSYIKCIKIGTTAKDDIFSGLDLALSERKRLKPGLEEISFNSFELLSSSTDIDGCVLFASLSKEEVGIVDEEFNSFTIGARSGSYSLFSRSPESLLNTRSSLGDEVMALFSYVRTIDKGRFAVFYEEDLLAEIVADIDELFGIFRETNVSIIKIMAITPSTAVKEMETTAQTIICLTSNVTKGKIEEFANVGHPNGKDLSFGVLSIMEDLKIDGLVQTMPFPDIESNNVMSISFRKAIENFQISHPSLPVPNLNLEVFEGYLAGSVAMEIIDDLLVKGLSINTSNIKDEFKGISTITAAGVHLSPTVGPNAVSASSSRTLCNRLQRTVFARSWNSSKNIWEVTDGKDYTFMGCGYSVNSREELTFGQIAAFSGPSANVGTCLMNGILAAFDNHNQENRLSSYLLKLKTVDDEYEPTIASKAAEVMLADKDVFALIGSVGTSPSLAIAPLAIEAGVPFIAPFSGSLELRRPFHEYIINIRTSYFDEAALHVKYLVDERKFKRISIMLQNDGFGWAGYDGVLSELTTRKLWLHSEGTYERNTVDLFEGISNIFSDVSLPEAIVFFGTALPLKEFIKLVRDRRWYGPIVAVSFAGAEFLSSLLEDTPLLRNNVYFSQAFHSPTNLEIPLVNEFHDQMAKQFPGEPITYCGLEGYVTGKFAATMLDKTRSKLSRRNFVNAIYESGVTSLGGIQLGPYIDRECDDLELSCECNQGSHSVILTEYDSNGSLIEVSDFPQFTFIECGFFSTYEFTECTKDDFIYEVSTCSGASGKRTVTFDWKVPYPRDPSKAWNCEGGVSIPSSTKIKCEYLQSFISLGFIIQCVSVVSCAFLCVSTLWIVLWRKEKNVTNGQPPLLISGLLGGIIICIGVFINVNTPITAICFISPFLVSVGFATMNGSLCMKVWRIKKIFLNKNLQRTRISIQRLMKYLTIIVLIDVLLWCPIILFDSSGVGYKERTYDDFVVQENVCNFSDFVSLLIAYTVVLVISPCYLSYKARYSPDRFNETKWIFFSTYNVLVIGSLSILLTFTLDISSEVSQFIFLLGILCATVGSQVALVIPKLANGISYHDNNLKYYYTSSAPKTPNGNETIRGAWFRRHDRLSTPQLISRLISAKKRISRLKKVVRTNEARLTYYAQVYAQTTALSDFDSEDINCSSTCHPSTISLRAEESESVHIDTDKDASKDIEQQKQQQQLAKQVQVSRQIKPKRVGLAPIILRRGDSRILSAISEGSSSPSAHSSHTSHSPSPSSESISSEESESSSLPSN
eukprot:TRINITY_DN7749_c0_g1_i3.p1 TRINITY_DN7749_c0_g1~~TRINITY_DN7749_c0_g1_i3.p1  ORF type:complete len:1274 (-),score=261.62 TRINITY_DN7749_c0_g1_i3:599-4420(-)